MKIKNLFTTIALFAQLASCGSAWAANPPLDYKAVARADSDLSQRINQDILSDRRLSAKDWEGLSVAVKNGTVSLSGTVTTDAALKEVRDIAKRLSPNVIFLVTSEETQERNRATDYSM